MSLVVINKNVEKVMSDAKNISDELTNKMDEYIQNGLQDELVEIMKKYIPVIQKIYVIYYPEVELYRGEYGCVNDINDARKFASKKAARLAMDFDRYEKQILYNGEIIFYGWRNKDLWLRD